MNRIRLLSEQVANQIAAGEVVERPASVVKELVENSLDARARRITVEIQAGGRSLIRVTDDGWGMSRDDALLCLERHATSKIKAAEDLQEIRTLGFRGEALPSIASVSRLTLTTREQNPECLAATQVVIHGGKIVAVKEAGAPPGTSLEVRQLFFNLPARRKFLRSEETERSHIQHGLTLAALAHPGVAFTFLNDERLVWQMPAARLGDSPGPPLPALRERWRALYGGDDELLAVDYATVLETSFKTEGETVVEQHPFKVWGLIGAPGVSRASRDNQHLFVNGRPVDNRGLNFALLEAYHTALMKGRYPVGCLFVEIDPSEVDVNIHPAKREVKFRHEQDIRRQVTVAVRQGLMGYHLPARPAGPPASISPAALPAGTQPRGGAPLPAPESPPPLNQGSLWGSSGPPAAGVRPAPALPDGPSHPPSARPAAPAGISPASTVVGAGTATPPAPAGPPPDPAGAGPAPLLAVPLRFIGVVGRLYVLFESDRGLVLLDQHAAHERILYEQMLNRLQAGPAPSQRLLLPETIELNPRDAQFLREQLAVLSRLGVGLSEFGDRTFLLDALPPFVRAANVRQFVLALIDELKATGQAVNSWRLGEDIIAKTVCRHAVKAQDPLAGAELEKLVAGLRRCEMPYTCPHGRPTLLEMNYRELEKRFGRIQ